jgi:protein O-GlcNAc transferase
MSGAGPQAILARGLEHHRAGRLAEAVGDYAAVLALEPDNLDALNLRGLAEHQRGDNAAALALLGRAHALKPDFTPVLQHLADVQRAAGLLDAARTSFAKLAAIAPGWHGGHFGLGQVLDLQGERAAAARAYEAAVAAKGDFAPALFALGLARAALGDAGAGRRHMEAALALGPRTPEALHGVAVLRLADGDAAGAEAALHECLALAPAHDGGLNTLFDLMLARGRLDDADAVAARLAAAEPGSALALLAQGRLLHARGRLSPAIGALARAFLGFAGAADPGAAAPFAALVAAARDAAKAKLVALAGGAAPGHPVTVDRLRAAAGSLGPLLLAFDDFAAARLLLDLAARLGSAEARQNRIAVELYDPEAGPDSYAKVHASYARAVRQEAGPPPPRPARGPRATLRIGYLSSDFRTHPAARCLLPLFEHRDRARFEAYGYSLCPAPDATTARFVSLADGWRDVAGRSDAAIARAIRDDRIDILVVYAGRFDRNRPTVALHAPAPVVVSLGDCATSGLAETDFLFADAHLVPRASREPFVERVLRLPCQYVNPPPEISPPVVPRPTGMPPAFASFSNPAKLNGATLALWARLLAQVPGSTLALGHHRAFDDPELAARVQAPFTAAGVDPARLVFNRSPRDPAAHLAAYAEIDVALDPFPFNGSTTTFEALWMGVPVVTLEGATMVARWSTAILRRIGCGDLVAPDAAAYVETAAALAADPARRADLRATLRGRLAASTTCDPALWMRHVERAFRAVWEADRTPTRAGRALV